MHLIKHKDKVRLREKRDEKGRKSGYEIDHSDGRVSAVVQPETVRGEIHVNGGRR